MDWPLVGRDDEREELCSLVEGGEGRPAVLTGRAGVGKTYLLCAVLADLTERGHHTELIKASLAASRVPLGAFAHLVSDRAPGLAGDHLALMRHTVDGRPGVAVREVATGRLLHRRRLRGRRQVPGRRRRLPHRARDRGTAGRDRLDGRLLAANTVSGDQERVARLERAIEHRNRLVGELGSELERLQAATDRAERRAQRLQEELDDARSALRHAERKLDMVYESETWRVGEALLRVPKAIRDCIGGGRSG